MYTYRHIYATLSILCHTKQVILYLNNWRVVCFFRPSPKSKYPLRIKHVTHVATRLPMSPTPWVPLPKRGPVNTSLIKRGNTRSSNIYLSRDICSSKFQVITTYIWSYDITFYIHRWKRTVYFMWMIDTINTKIVFVNQPHFLTMLF